MHSELIKSTLFADFYQLYPKKFQNKTNGVTPRRWIVCANRKLSQLYTEQCSDYWMLDMTKLRTLASKVDDM